MTRLAPLLASTFRCGQRRSSLSPSSVRGDFPQRKSSPSVPALEELRERGPSRRGTSRSASLYLPILPAPSLLALSESLYDVFTCSHALHLPSRSRVLGSGSSLLASTTLDSVTSIPSLRAQTHTGTTRRPGTRPYASAARRRGIIGHTAGLRASTSRLPSYNKRGIK